jgi:hypothetical protein
MAQVLPAFDRAEAVAALENLRRLPLNMVMRARGFQGCFTDTDTIKRRLLKFPQETQQRFFFLWNAFHYLSVVCREDWLSDGYI